MAENLHIRFLESCLENNVEDVQFENSQIQEIQCDIFLEPWLYLLEVREVKS